MKYKNRKDAKRKYKQALLATVATISLGMSTFGGTASVFAAENATESGTQTENKKSLEDRFIEKATKQLNLNTAGKFSATTMGELYKYANKGPTQLNDALRAITIAGTDFLPYGGMFVSQLISAIWPETNGINSQLNALREELTKLIKSEMDNEQLNFLNSEFKTLQDLQKKLDNAVNSENSQNSDENTKNQRGAWANGIEQSFERLLDHTSDDKHKVTNLPLYTKVALAHLMFLQSLNNKAIASKMNITDQSLQEFYTMNGINTLANDYVSHIMKTYYDATGTHIEKIEKINKVKEIAQFTFNPDDAENQIKDLKNRLASVTAKKDKRFDMYAQRGQSVPAHDDVYAQYKSDISILEDVIPAYEFVAKLYTTTVGDPAIKELAKGTWVQKNSKWHFVDKDGHDKIGLIYDGGKPYYLSMADDTKNLAGTTFGKGEMLTGFVKIGGKTYHFNNSGELTFVDGTYKIVYSKANKVVDFGYDGKEHPVIWDYHDGKNQQWEFEYDAEKNAYQIINKDDERVLAYNTSGASDTALVTSNDHKPEHYWILEDTEDRNVLLVNYADNKKVLDVYGEKTDGGSRLFVQDKLNNSAAQKFKLVKID
ncbi:TPA: insecticidal delta-endotoxin Cry8Ea1 family protein [Bacillus cereus]|uniref:insecticidal delta-endotoxin Cry8Ea1 family protein n=1 Tax=Bacillus cereus TaxID=1396 RepID=UPI00065BE488|nr:insecticidal delta-endotoxin Cry8Ea1 family protein [Bacillus cereus]KMQ22153.1 hypothetical protein TU58_30325 [Bacillus cereus]